jgi:hypothetical protein
MNNFKILSLLLYLVLFFSCENKNEDVFRGILANGELGITEIASVTSVRDSTATLNCIMSFKGKGYLLARGVCWSTTENPTIENGHVAVKDTGTVILYMSKLAPGTLYYVRPYITNNEGTGYGNEISFTTKNVPTITIATSATNLTTVSATLTGTVSNDGGDSVTVRGVCWSTSAKPTIALTTKTINGAGKGSFNADLSGLTIGTTYHARAYATNAYGTAYSPEVTFTTQNLPTLTTTAVSNITSVTATSGGTISSDGGSTIIFRGICWSTTQNPTIDLTTKTNEGIGMGTFTSTLLNLQLGTTYHVRAYATNAIGTSYGAQQTFTTNGYANVTTNAVSSITATTATCGGNITADGGTTVSARGVCWSSTTNPTISDSKTTDGTGIGTFTSSLTGLTAGTTYYVRAYATNSTGAVYGSVISFTTNAITLPTLTTTTISSITTTTASSGGTITNDGGAAITARGVCWSTSSNPTISNNITSDGTGNGVFSSSITGLLKGVTYYVRAYATNIIGTVYGAQVNFTTYSTLVIGMPYLGGKIAYIDASGIHGFVCALSDQSSGVQWYNGNDVVTGAINSIIETSGVYGISKSGGRKNTDAIIAKQGIGNYAAYICAQMTDGGATKGDWFLPSLGEFSQIYANRSILGGFSKDVYWTSTEIDYWRAQFIQFNYNLQYYNGKNLTYPLRAIRAF